VLRRLREQYPVLPWLALHGADAWADDRVCIHHLQPPPPPREIYLCWQAGRTHSPLAARAIDITVELATDLTRQMSPTTPQPGS
jgi:DNA-binding transcriptional LysR family regulator